jgi:2-dehydropantoate 2-reductase
MRYGVIGTGALGGFYGGMLSKSGREVHFLFRSDFEFVRENGLQVDSVNGNFHLDNVNAYASTHEMPVCDVVLVCLKTTGNHMLPEMLKPILHPKTLVVLLQNGLGLEEELAAQLPQTSIAGGLAFICSNKIGPGRISHLDLGKLIIGSYNVSDCEILDKVISNLQLAGVNAELAPDLQFARWQKLVWNIPFNGMTVVWNTTTDNLISDEQTLELAREMMLEVIRGANACGVSLNESLAQKMIDMTLRMKPYAPSMKLDFDSRRPMEIEYIYSRPIETAEKAGFDMKHVASLEKQLRLIQENY